MRIYFFLCVLYIERKNLFRVRKIFEVKKNLKYNKDDSVDFLKQQPLALFFLYVCYNPL